MNEWKTHTQKDSTTTALGIDFVDLVIPRRQKHPVRFTMYWTEEDRWEGRDYTVAVLPGYTAATG